MIQKKETQQIIQNVKEYYGETLKTSEDLLSNACCVGQSSLTKQQKQVLSTLMHEQIVSKFYGCGSPIPPQLEGKTVVDLGCGTGRDVYLSSYFVKQQGEVIGIDMTENQLIVARKHIDYMMQKYGFKKPNVKFIEGVIENIPLKDNSVDVVISNCVINLCSDKKAVFKQIWRCLKEGGELYFSDVYSDRRIGQAQKNDKILWGQCLSGALYIEDFRRIMQQVGFKDCRILSKSQITINNDQIQKKCNGIKFYSITYRCFKLKDMEDRCEDFGQVVKYKGGIFQFEKQFPLDSTHSFKLGQQVKVCGNTASMLENTRFSPYFQVTKKGDHKGLFDCSVGANNSNCQGSTCC